MRGNFELLFRDRLIVFLLSLSLISYILLMGFFVLIRNRLPPYIPLFNSLPWGEGRLVATQFIFIFLSQLGLFFCLNTLVGLSLYKKFTLISRILAFNFFLCIMLTLAAFLHIIFLVL